MWERKRELLMKLINLATCADFEIEMDYSQNTPYYSIVINSDWTNIDELTDSK